MESLSMSPVGAFSDCSAWTAMQAEDAIVRRRDMLSDYAAESAPLVGHKAVPWGTKPFFVTRFGTKRRSTARRIYAVDLRCLARAGDANRTRVLSLGSP